ncbi:MAG: fibronectin type III domain-containing protein [Treponema sp.]|nr:fibronectin type III domain-containing protein [Candidatus Treponema caballi]
MTKKQITFFSAVCLLLLLAPAFLSATEKTYTFGGLNGWNSVVNRNNVVSGRGTYGYECLTLDDISPSPDAASDLLLTFDDGCYDEAFNYTMVSGNADLTKDAKRGTGSALFWGNEGLSLRGGSNSLFGTEGETGSFTISFWLKPLMAANGEMIFSWFSSRNLDEYSLYQMITVMLTNNHLQWDFGNIFERYSGDGSRLTVSEENNDVLVTGKTILVPETWSFHELSYDDVTGMIEYRVNNRVEDILYVTSTGGERGLIYPAVLGVKADINICSSYIGYLDNFYISRNSRETPSVTDTYEVTGGTFETPIFSMEENGATIRRILVTDTQPDQTQIDYYIRSDSSRWNWTESYPAWQKFTPGQDMSGLSDRYFQIAARLYPDGAGSVSPSVTEIQIAYEPVEPPDPPYQVFAQPGDGYVDISWISAPGSKTVNGGYLVYYGERPGEYLGSEAVQGVSPVMTGNADSIRISGLTNGKIYYFAVASYNIGEEILSGPLSREVYARPTGR